MRNLNAEEVKQLADNFLQMANALGDYRYTNIDSLTEDENLSIKGMHNQQLTYTTELYTKSAVLVLEDIQDSLNQIDTITKESLELYKKLTNVQTILDRASAILNLASAILALDVKGVTRNIQELVS